MISPASFITPTLIAIERQNCPRGYSYYHCGSYSECCDVDPCQPQYLSEDDPCYAAGGDPLTTTTTITTTKHTQATTILTDFTTEDPETETSTKTTSPSSSTKTEASSTTTSTDGTTLSTSVISTSDAPNSATRTLPAPLPTTASPPEDKTLPNGTIAGISVVSAIGAIVILTSFFWFARRRRMSKRMSSLRGTSPTPMESPSMGFEFGFGAAGREAGVSPPAPDAQGQCSELPTPLGLGTQAEKQQLQAGPIPTGHAELDSSEMPRPIPSIQQTTLSTPAPDNTNNLTAQPQLPSYSPSSPMSGTQTNNINNNDNGGHLHPPLLTPGFRGGGGGGVQSNRESASFPWIQPRATLNATDEERVNNQYANSWASGP